MLYRMKPVIVDAHIFDGSPDLARKLGLEIVPSFGGKTLSFYLKTANGIYPVTATNWVVTNADGIKHVCTDEVFRMHYEEVIR